MTTTPRVKAGPKMHRIGEEAYVVVIDSSNGDREVSDRHHGNVWISVGPGAEALFRAELLFVDDQGDGNWSTFRINRWADLARIALFVDGELVYYLGGYSAYYPSVGKGTEVRVDWSGAFDGMA